MNWDEVVAFLAVLVLTPQGLGWQAGAFFAFRFFDIAKPPPIRHLERTMKGGFGRDARRRRRGVLHPPRARRRETAPGSR